ncbi:unnamed protein product, partial [Ectocarpus sp. 13 AM-2016]
TYSTIHGLFCIGSQNFWVFWVCCIGVPRTSWCTQPGGSVRSVCGGGGVGGDVCNETNRLIFIIIEEHESFRGECGKRWSRVEGRGYVAGYRLMFSFLSSSEGVCSEHVPLAPPPPSAASLSPKQTVAVKISPLVAV